jgi:alpha-ketoglutaric semialdehyde dehydrogenase
MTEQKEEVARLLTREEGKTYKDSLAEVGRTIQILEFMAGGGCRLAGETLPSELPENFAYTIKQPLGVVGAITPWNFPVAIPVWKAAPAL